MQKALEGIRVLSFSEYLAAPYAQMVMADMGAEIIKIERPGTGDGGRAFGPWVKGESAYFTSLNRNARSVVVNLKVPEGIEIIKQLVKVSDVVLENFRADTLERLGLGYSQLRELNPKVIYTSISGFGHNDILPSPYSLSSRPAFDIVAQAMGGIMSVTGPVGGPPVKVGAGIGDIIPGLFGVVGTLAALRVAHFTGEGQHVDISMVDGIMATLENAIQMYTHGGIIRQPEGSKHHASAPFDCFPAKDGWVVIAAANDRLWVKLCKALGREEWGDDPRFVTNEQRFKNYDALIRPWMEEWTSQRTKAEIEAILLEADVPVAPVLNNKEVIESPHTAARQMLVEVEHPIIGKEPLVNSPIKMSRTMPGIETAAPLLGQHTEEVLQTLLDYSQQEIRALEEKEIIYCRRP